MQGIEADLLVNGINGLSASMFIPPVLLVASPRCFISYRSSGSVLDRSALSCRSDAPNCNFNKDECWILRLIGVGGATSLGVARSLGLTRSSSGPFYRPPLLQCPEEYVNAMVAISCRYPQVADLAKFHAFSSSSFGPDGVTSGPIPGRSMVSQQCITWASRRREASIPNKVLSASHPNLSLKGYSKQ